MSDIENNINIYELLSYDGKEFIRNCYIKIIGREPDNSGLAYYLGRLSCGIPKEQIIWQINSSDEAKPEVNIRGLDKIYSRSLFNRIKILLSMSSRSIVFQLSEISQNLKIINDTILSSRIAGEKIPIVDEQNKDHIKLLSLKIEQNLSTNNDVQSYEIVPDLIDSIIEKDKTIDFFYEYFWR